MVAGWLGAALALTSGLLAGGAARNQAARPVPAPDAHLLVEPVESPAPPGSGQPQLAVDSRGRFLLSWVERGEGPASRFRLARLDAARWSAARTIAEGSDFFVNWADVPSVFALSDGRLAAHWLAKNGEGTFAYDVRLRTSTDEGATWSPPVTPHRDGTQTEHGFASFFEMPDGAIGLAWLDGRHMTAGGHDAHGHGAGAMTLRATSIGRDGRPGPDWVLDDQPVWLKTRAKPLVNVPYTQECNDVAMMLIQHHKASEYRDRAIDQFDQLYADARNEARIMALVVHPYIMGAPHRLRYFREALAHIRARGDAAVWTGGQICDWFVGRSPAPGG